MILDPLIYQVDLLYMLETMYILHHQRTPIQGSLMVEIQETLRHPFLSIPLYQQWKTQLLIQITILQFIAQIIHWVVDHP